MNFEERIRVGLHDKEAVEAELQSYKSLADALKAQATVLQNENTRLLEDQADRNRLRTVVEARDETISSMGRAHAAEMATRQASFTAQQDDLRLYRAT